jgi:hypothetical protein
VEDAGLGATPLSGTGVLFYRIDGGYLYVTDLTEVGPNEYEIHLPGVACGSSVEFYVTANAEYLGEIYMYASPPDAPNTFHMIIAGYPFDFNHDCIIDQEDLGVILADYECDSGDCVGDVDGDGDTDQSDLGILLSYWGLGY